MVTSGPGVTNLVTPIADAFYDSTPLVALTGQVGTADIRAGRRVRQRGFQEVDTPSLLKSLTKEVFQPMTPGELPGVLRRAFTIANEGRPGPVVVDLPMDVQKSTECPPGDAEAHDPPSQGTLDMGLVEKAASWIAEAERPVVFAGQGVLIAEACEPLRRLVHSRRIPTVMSMLGLGAVPTDSEVALGFPGHTGNRCANRVIHEADVLLALGVRLDVRQTGTLTEAFVPNGRIVRIDLDEGELSFPRVKTHINILADAGAALEALLQALESRPPRDLAPWWERVEELRCRSPLSFEGAEGLLKPQQVVETVNRLTRGRAAVAVSGVGSHQQWTARHFDFDHPQRAWLTSGGHGAMGYDLPTAIGAQLNRPDDLVLCFVGDGSLQLNIQELQTAVDYQTPVKIFVLDNSRLAMVSQFQLMNWGSDPTTGGKSNPDFAAIARAYGLEAFTLSTPDELESVARRALDHDGPALVHCRVDPREDVSPMLLPGKAMDAMWPYV
jgi:acetolactate synthase-1/2/3 large subunit